MISKEVMFVTFIHNSLAMRIFLDATTISPVQSGTGAYTRNLLQSLPHVSGAEHVYAAVGPETGKFLSLPEKTTLLNKHCSPHRVLNHQLIGNRDRIPADLAIFPNYFMPLFWEIPSAVTVHDLSFLSHPHYYSFKMRQWYRRRIRHSVDKASLFLTVSEASARQINRHLGVPYDRILVHPPCWLESKPIVPHEQRSKTLLYLGNMEPKKNILTLIEAFNRSGLTQYCLELVGKLHAGGSWARAFRHLADASDRVTWTGYLSDDEVKRRLSEAFGFINLSHIEGFGLPHAEALSCGTPCLISHDAAMQEVSGGRSLVTDPDDTAQIAGQMRALAEYDFDKAREHAAEMWERFSRKKYMESLEKITNRLTSENAPLFPGFGAGRPNKTTAVLATASYAAVFGEPLSVSKMYLAFPLPVTAEREVRNEAARLAKQYPGLVSMRRDQFRILQPDAVSNIRKLDGQKVHSLVRRRHQLLLRLLGRVPLIRAVYYSGGTAHQTSLYDKPDLDLFIVTRKNSVWISYLIIRLLSMMMLRKDSCCSNYLVDEHAQEIFWQRDYYTAFQLLFLKQVFRKPGTRHIRQCNPWIRQFFPNAPVTYNTAENTHESENKSAGTKSLISGLVFAANLAVMRLFAKKWEMNGRKNRSGGLMWDAFRIKLHSNDHRPWVYRRYDHILQNTLSRIRSSNRENVRKVSGSW